jgi:hypothetical protein
VGGFDLRYRAAGDDVDLCWRIQDRGWTIGFSPAAFVWHHRRNSIRAYWRQQKGYGRAEALLEQKWPERYNVLGHYAWNGRIYGAGLTLPLPLLRNRIYGGTWGTAPFQSLYGPPVGLIRSMALMPEWFLLIVVLAALCSLGVLWRHLLFSFPLLVLAAVTVLTQAVVSAGQARPAGNGRSRTGHLRLRLLTAALHVIGPAARLWGRLQSGLTPWRAQSPGPVALPFARHVSLWSEIWHPAEEWIAYIERELKASGSVVLRTGPFDRWDLTVRGGLFASARILSVIEEHGAGTQVIRFSIRPQWTAALSVFVLVLLALTVIELSGGTRELGLGFLLVLVLVLSRGYWEAATATGTAQSVCSSVESAGLEQDRAAAAI